MRCLTVRQPWAWAIISGLKAIENRSWPTRHRGELAIHAGRSLAEFGGEDDFTATMPGLPPKGQFPLGAIVGVVRVIDCLPYEQVKDRPFAERMGPESWCWMLEEPLAFPVPVPWAGRLGLFEVPDDVIRQALEGAAQG